MTVSEDSQQAMAEQEDQQDQHERHWVIATGGMAMLETVGKIFKGPSRDAS